MRVLFALVFAWRAVHFLPVKLSAAHLYNVPLKAGLNQDQQWQPCTASVLHVQVRKVQPGTCSFAKVQRIRGLCYFISCVLGYSPSCEADWKWGGDLLGNIRETGGGATLSGSH